MNDPTSKSDAPTFIGAKASRYQQDEQIATLAGDVVMRQGSMQIKPTKPACIRLKAVASSMARYACVTTVP